MSSAGNRGMISNNLGSSGFGNRRGSKESAEDKANTATSARRSSSGTSAQKFAGLHSQKRTSQDATAAARKASFADQSKAPGFFGGIWQSFTKGSGK
ncbi:hypothetical protein MMC28_001618 [Mycoblastus sanguinarius]|nr:hypothetical protein [Mycoblastus sanguinarius]